MEMVQSFQSDSVDLGTRVTNSLSFHIMVKHFNFPGIKGMTYFKRSFVSLEI